MNSTSGIVNVTHSLIGVSNVTSLKDDSLDITPQIILSETKFEYGLDLFLGCSFLITAILAIKSLKSEIIKCQNQSQPHRVLGNQDAPLQRKRATYNVFYVFYSLILLTSILRSSWFLIPKTLLKPSYTPSSVMAFDSNPDINWIGAFFSEVLVSVGSLSLFSIFILILVYWADILQKYFYPGVKRDRPTKTFRTFMIFLGVVMISNFAFFLCRQYSVEGMILVNAILLSMVSIICVVEISIFSKRFQIVLKTLGVINQVSTESQVKRIVRIAITGNIFFFTRAFVESVMCFMLIFYWHQYGNVNLIFTHKLWDSYIILKHGSEMIILCLMLYILQSHITSDAGTSLSHSMDRGGYEKLGEVDKIQQQNTVPDLNV